MAQSADPDFTALLNALTGGGVEFIVVGGVAAVLNGAPITTFDLDVAHSRFEDNISSLLRALRCLDAYYRGRGDDRLRPGRDHLASQGHRLLMTRFGPIDLLGTIGAGRGYEELLGRSIEYEVGGLRFRVLDLETLTQIERCRIQEHSFVIPAKAGI